MASTTALEKKEPKDSEPRPKISKGAETADLSKSLTDSWVSGPELIMPSICETFNPEDSWVEYVRTPKQSGSEGTKKRRKVSSPNTKLQKAQAAAKAAKSDNEDAGSSKPEVCKRPSKATLGINTTLVRAAINTVLITFILHLLVLPEVIHQARDLCQIPKIKSIYPSSCAVPQASNPNHSAAIDLTTSQTTLQSILTTTLSTLTPLSSTLQESQSMLANLSTQLKTTFPDARHTLSLEFSGSDQALQRAVWEFESLRTDLGSALDSLLASPPQSTVAIQLRRRTEYLERLRSQIRSKADSLNTRFTTLDDHLEAVGMIAREYTHQEGESSVLDSLPFGSLFRRSSGDADANVRDSSSRPATMALLRVAATHHAPVADSVLWLSRQLGST